VAGPGVRCRAGGNESEASPAGQTSAARRFKQSVGGASGHVAKTNQEIFIMKRTYQASKTRRARTHGFLVRMKTRGGRAVINARRAKGRKRLAV